MDHVSAKTRSAIMSRVRSSGNRSTERRFCAALAARGITGWEKHPDIAGKPDIVFAERRVVVFLDGCFWHKCPTCRRRWPRSRRAYWREKIEGNAKRDAAHFRRLRREGWTVLRLWEHEILKNPQKCVDVVRKALDAVGKPSLAPQRRKGFTR